jgi:RHS repeat-associated protein
VSKVDFYANDGTTNTLVGTATAEPYSYTWSNVALGNYSITAIATDTLNATTTSTPVSVTVNTGIAQAYYIYSDHLDSPRVITDTQGNKVWEWQNSDPYGNNVPNENPSGAGQFTFPLRFPGQYADKETNSYYNVNRDYDPAIGRYVQSDPIGLMGGINTYIYAGGDPIMKVDILGLDSYNHFYPSDNPGVTMPCLPTSRQIGFLELRDGTQVEVYRYSGQVYSYYPQNNGTMLLELIGGRYEIVGPADLGNGQCPSTPTCGGK